jgi:hypothetical protein
MEVLGYQRQNSDERQKILASQGLGMEVLGYQRQNSDERQKILASQGLGMEGQGYQRQNSDERQRLLAVSTHGLAREAVSYQRQMSDETQRSVFGHGDKKGDTQPRILSRSEPLRVDVDCPGRPVPSSAVKRMLVMNQASAIYNSDTEKARCDNQPPSCQTFNTMAAGDGQMLQVTGIVASSGDGVVKTGSCASNALLQPVGDLTQPNKDMLPTTSAGGVYVAEIKSGSSQIGPKPAVISSVPVAIRTGIKDDDRSKVCGGKEK